MKVDSTARQGGKTTRMIAALLHQKDAVMVVHSHMERQRLIGKYPDLKRRVFTFDDFPTLSRGVVSPDTPVFVDNADIFLRRMLGNVTYISLTTEEEAPLTVDTAAIRALGYAVPFTYVDEQQAARLTAAVRTDYREKYGVDLSDNEVRDACGLPPAREEGVTP